METMRKSVGVKWRPNNNMVVVVWKYNLGGILLSNPYALRVHTVLYAPYASVFCMERLRMHIQLVGVQKNVFTHVGVLMMRAQKSECSCEVSKWFLCDENLWFFEILDIKYQEFRISLIWAYYS